jgi:glycosyltransferase involved in cell wall biosynthesis
MRVLLAHNFYQKPGGEDRVFAAESALLKQYSHEVVTWCEHNDRVAEIGRARLAAKTVWNGSSYSGFRSLLRQEKPDVCHFHNTFPLISPAAFHAAKAEGVPVVLTLHNYRLLCPSATFLRDGKVCEDCGGKPIAWPAVVHRCYRDSRSASAATAMMLGVHRAFGTWAKAVDVYIALTEFARRKFIAGGLPASKVVVKPNFVHPDPRFSHVREDYALFVGRLAPEKGIDTLLDAWQILDAPMRLRIAGDGPLAAKVQDHAAKDRRIEWLGALPSDAVAALMRSAYVLVFPSVWFEGLPLTVLEAYATGLPVLASSIGGLVQLVPQDAGLQFRPGDAADLASQVKWCRANPQRMAALGQAGRTKYEREFTAESNYRQLIGIYEGVSVDQAWRKKPSHAGLATIRTH